MSTQESPRISDDLRYELADAARSAESANRPKALLALATLLFALAGVALVVTLRQLESAKGQYEAQQGYQQRIADLKIQYARAEALKSSGQAEHGEPISDLFSRIETAAHSVGLSQTPKIPRIQSATIGTAIRNEYPYQMQDPSLQNLLAWVEACRRDVPGLEVTSLKITPAAKHWNFEVKFVRWERSS